MITSAYTAGQHRRGNVIDRLMVISVDCQAGLPTDQYVGYLESTYRQELRAYCARRDEAWQAGATLGSNMKGFAIFTQQFLEDFKNESLVGRWAEWRLGLRPPHEGARGRPRRRGDLPWPCQRVPQDLDSLPGTGLLR